MTWNSQEQKKSRRQCGSEGTGEQLADVESVLVRRGGKLQGEDVLPKEVSRMGSAREKLGDSGVQS